MENLESEEEDDPSRVLCYKPMSWLGQNRSHHRDETWSEGLWQTFFASCVGTYIPDLTELPLSTCGWRKFQIDTFGDHLCTCTVHSGGIFGTVSKRYMTGRLVRSLTFSTQYTKCKLWYLTSVSTVNDSGVVLTLILMDTYSTLTTWISHWMRLSLTRLEYISLTIITILLIIVYPLCRPLLVRPGGYIVTLCVSLFTSSSGNWPFFLQFQELILCILPVSSSTTTLRRSPLNLDRGSAVFSLRLQHYGLLWI